MNKAIRIPDREDRFDEHDRRERRRAGLAQESEDVARRGPATNGAAHESCHQAGADRLFVGDLLGFDELEHVREGVEERGRQGEEYGERDLPGHVTSITDLVPHG